MNEKDMREIEFLKVNVVQPMITAFQKEVQPIVDAAAKHEERITKLESNQRKALTGYTAFVSVVSTGIALISANVKAWFNKKASGH